jgi:hemerythrin superfamily protein
MNSPPNDLPADRFIAGQHDAIEMLIADHKAVNTLFGKFHALLGDRDAASEKALLVKQICDALDVHVRIEEELFYPAVRQAIRDESLMDVALIEQAGAKALVAQLQAMHVGDKYFDAKVTVLAEQVIHHAEEEEKDMFAEVRKARVDTLALGAEMAIRRAQLIAAQQVAVPPQKPRGQDGASMAAR